MLIRVETTLVSRKRLPSRLTVPMTRVVLCTKQVLVLFDAAVFRSPPHSYLPVSNIHSARLVDQTGHVRTKDQKGDGGLNLCRPRLVRGSVLRPQER